MVDESKLHELARKHFTLPKKIKKRGIQSHTSRNISPKGFKKFKKAFIKGFLIGLEYNKNITDNDN